MTAARISAEQGAEIAAERRRQEVAQAQETVADLWKQAEDRLAQATAAQQVFHLLSLNISHQAAR